MAQNKTQFSIHPRSSMFGRSGEKLNTCSPWKGKGKLAKRQAHLTMRRTAHSATLKGLGAKTPPSAYKTPGSMKGRS